MNVEQKDLDRFFAKVDKTDTCWNWTGGMRGQYGLFRYGNKVRSAHVASYMMFKGDRNGLIVRHTCDNGRCVNPDHLVLGTHGQNSVDMMERDRHNAVLRNADVIEIRSRPMTDTIIYDLSQEFGVRQNLIRSALDGRTFSHLPGARKIVRQKTRYKLTKETIKEIKEALKNPYWGQVNDLAKKYGVTHSQISHIKSGRIHSDVSS